MEANPASGDPREVVPFLGVSHMEQSLRYYVDGLGFAIRHRWVDAGKLRWCWLTRGAASLMLQEFWKEGHHAGRPDGALGQGVMLWFQCGDALALHREFSGRGIEGSEPRVENGFWATHLTDPDGYRLGFESPTDAPEGARLSEVRT